MRIRQLMTADPATCRPDTNLAVVAQIMWDRDCGFVPVTEADGRVIGVITDRDICIAAATRRVAPEQLTAADAMSHRPIYTARPDDRAEKALDIMKQFQVRRLPIVNADGTIAGVVSMNDAVRAAAQPGGPAEADLVAALAAICARRPPKVSAA